MRFVLISYEYKIYCIFAVFFISLITRFSDTSSSSQNTAPKRNALVRAIRFTGSNGKYYNLVSVKQSNDRKISSLSKNDNRTSVREKEKKSILANDSHHKSGNATEKFGKKSTKDFKIKFTKTTKAAQTNTTKEYKNNKPNKKKTSWKKNNEPIKKVPRASKNSSIEELVLQRHNMYRKKHNVPPLILNKKISIVSQEWAQHLAKNKAFYHRPKGLYGENLFSMWSSDPKFQLSPNQPVDSWYSEIYKYNYKGKEHNIQETGHFTQVVWKNSKELGVGIAKGKNNMVIVVCNYNPPGNYIGKFADNVLPAI